MAVTRSAIRSSEKLDIIRPVQKTKTKKIRKESKAVRRVKLPEPKNLKEANRECSSCIKNKEEDKIGFHVLKNFEDYKYFQVDKYGYLVNQNFVRHDRNGRPVVDKDGFYINTDGFRVDKDGERTFLPHSNYEIRKETIEYLKKQVEEGGEGMVFFHCRDHLARSYNAAIRYICRGDRKLDDFYMPYYVKTSKGYIHLVIQAKTEAFKYPVKFDPWLKNRKDAGACTWLSDFVDNPW